MLAQSRPASLDCYTSALRPCLGKGNSFSEARIPERRQQITRLTSLTAGGGKSRAIPSSFFACSHTEPFHLVQAQKEELISRNERDSLQKVEPPAMLESVPILLLTWMNLLRSNDVKPSCFFMFPSLLEQAWVHHPKRPCVS